MFDVWHIGVPVKNLNQSVEFYVTGLGFEFLGYYEKTMAFVRPPGKNFTIEFLEFKEDAPGFDRKPHHIAFECENVEQFREDLIKKGFFREIQEITPSNNQMRLFAVTDPDGIKVQFYQGKAGFDKAIEHTINQYSDKERIVLDEDHHSDSSATKATDDDYYKVLGVKSTATLDEITKSFRTKAAQLHPDNKATGDQQSFERLAAAYDVLVREKKAERSRR